VLEASKARTLSDNVKRSRMLKEVPLVGKELSDYVLRASSLGLNRVTVAFKDVYLPETIDGVKQSLIRHSYKVKVSFRQRNERNESNENRIVFNISW